MLDARQVVIWATAYGLSAAVAAQQAVPSPAAGAASGSDAQEAVQPKISPLLMLVLSRVASEAGKKVGTDLAKVAVQRSPGLFGNLLAQLGWGSKVDRGKGDDRDLATAVGYTIQQLDPRSFEVIRALEVGNAPTVLKTGDVFAIHYSTNLPGQVRLENVNPAGRISDLGTYTVQVDQLNRLPRDQGIRLEGAPGLELLKVYFYPCLPPETAGQASEAQFGGRLPICGRPQNTQVAAALTNLQARTLVNLSQPDKTVAFAGAEDYRTNEVVLTVVRIQHEGPGSGR